MFIKQTFVQGMVAALLLRRSHKKIQYKNNTLKQRSKTKQKTGQIGRRQSIWVWNRIHERMLHHVAKFAEDIPEALWNSVSDYTRKLNVL